MPDSLLPIQGPASQRERDLDSLLSGEAGHPTVVLGPVAGVLAALRGAPVAGELDGEAAARAAFRLLMLPDGQGSTAVPPWTAPGGPRHARPRRRAPLRRALRRRAQWHGRWQVMTAVGGAAAAVIVCLVALAGAFSGPGGQQGRPGQRPSAQATGTGSKHPASSVLNTGTARPLPSPSAVSPKELCSQYTEFFTHPEPPAKWSAERSVLEQLSSLAGGWQRIAGYCGQFSAGSSGSSTDFHSGAADPGSGRPSGRGESGEHATPRVGRAEVGGHFGGR